MYTNVKQNLVKSFLSSSHKRCWQRVLDAMPKEKEITFKETYVRNQLNTQYNQALSEIRTLLESYLKE